jgi:hypothetical protein
VVAAVTLVAAVAVVFQETVADNSKKFIRASHPLGVALNTLHESVVVLRKILPTGKI